MSRRNFSPWAYWSLHLQGVVDSDPLPEMAVSNIAASDPDGFATWRDRASQRLTRLLGPAPEPVPLDTEVGDAIDRGDHREFRVVFDSEAAMSVPARLLVPRERTAAGPAVLAVHGHGPGKSRICGDDGDQHEHYALQLVRLGYVVLAPDLRCFGERQDPQWEPGTAKYDCDWNLVAATMAGVTPLAQNLWDLQRSLDVLGAHPLVDPARLGAVGFSYGATLTLFLAAVDDRVRAAIVSGYLSSWRAAHAVPWNMCGSQVMFGQLGAVEHADVAALVAPRALLVESGRSDPIFPVTAARSTMARLRSVWAAHGAGDALVHQEFDGDHRWGGAGAEEFLVTHL